MRQLGDYTAVDWPPETLKKYDEISWIQFLKNRGASYAARQLLNLGVAKEEDFQQVSALWVLREMMNSYSPATYKIAGGNDLLPRAFAARLAGKIRYGTKALRIEREDQSVCVIYRKAGSTHSISGDFLICTLPFSVLRRLEIEPSFSPKKQRAIDELFYGPASRVSVQCAKRSWLEYELNGFARTDHPLEIWNPTFDQSRTRGILQAYMRMSYSKRFMEMDEEEQVHFTKDRIVEVYPEIKDDMEGGTVKRWESDPWALGAMAVFKVGQISSFLPHIARPEQRVHFAGDHTSPWNGYMEGALESGARAAKEINEASFLEI